MEALAALRGVRPAGSVAAPTWFNLGDRDLATHLYRTARLAEGATLTEVTDEIRRAWGVGVRLLPMTDDGLRTMVTLAGRRRRSRSRTTSCACTTASPVRAVRFDASTGPR